MPRVIIGVKETASGWMGVSSEGYTTDGWPSKELATERIRQHKDEVEAGRDPATGLPVKPMELLSKFRERNGLIADGKRAVLKGAEILPEPEPETEDEVSDADHDE